MKRTGHRRSSRAVIGGIAASAALFASAPALAGCTDPAGPGVSWRRCYLEDRPLVGVDLTGADLREARFNRADLRDAILVEVQGRRAKFITVTAQNADFSGSKLREVDFTKANLDGAKFINADLQNARLFRASLRGADFTGADLFRTDFLEADLSGATWIDGERICAEGSNGQCR